MNPCYTKFEMNIRIYYELNIIFTFIYIFGEKVFLVISYIKGSIYYF